MSKKPKNKYKDPEMAHVNLWFDHEPMLYVVTVADAPRPYMFVTEKKARKFAEHVGAASTTIVNAWLFDDAATAVASYLSETGE